MQNSLRCDILIRFYGNICIIKDTFNAGSSCFVLYQGHRLDATSSQICIPFRINKNIHYLMEKGIVFPFCRFRVQPSMEILLLLSSLLLLSLMKLPFKVEVVRRRPNKNIVWPWDRQSLHCSAYQRRIRIICKLMACVEIGMCAKYHREISHY